MFISMAQAQENLPEVTPELEVIVGEAQSAGSAFAWNMGLILVLVAMFYFLLIRPQQKRFAAHQQMVDALKKGDAVVTAGGLVGKISKLVNDTEVEIDLGGTKVTAVRNTLTVKDAPKTTSDKTTTNKK